MESMEFKMNQDTKDRNTKLFLHMKKWLEKAVLDYKMIQKGVVC